MDTNSRVDNHLPVPTTRLRTRFTPVIGWLALVGSMLLSGGAGGAPALAQVSGSRGSMGLGTQVNGVVGGSCTAGLCGVSGGTSSGSNLFHRFSTFDTRGGIQGVNFQTEGHRNLFVGVTSPLGSFINQPISLNMPANLFWLSPGGIAISGAGGFQNVQRLQLSTATGIRVGSGLFDAVGTTAAEAALLSGSPLLGLPGLVSDEETLGGMGLKSNGDLEIDGGLLTVDQGMLLDAQGGHVLLAGSRLEVSGGDVEVAGDVVRLENSTVDASDPQASGGSISIRAGTVLQNGDLLAAGASGGSVVIETAGDLQSSGRIDASGTDGLGGSVALEAGGDIVQTNQSALVVNGNAGGGRIKVQAGEELISSAHHQADGLAQGTLGGLVELSGKEVVLLAAQASADGQAGGGSVRVGGDSQGASLSLGGRNADVVAINPSTVLSADATDSGTGGEVVVWSELNTTFQGRLRSRGGPNGGDGGRLDVSSSQDLSFIGKADGSAAQGTGGQLLLEAENIVIDANAPEVDFLTSGWLNPSGEGGARPAPYLTTLSNGNVVAIDQYNDFLASNAGAVYQFGADDGALQSILRGDTASSLVGSGGIHELANGNYLISSPSWDKGKVVDAGAVTWADGSTGITAVVHDTNSLVGSSAGDAVGSGGLTPLPSGNFVVSSPNWDHGSVVDAGAATFGDGSTGIAGAVSLANSLVGRSKGDRVSSGGIRVLSNGNYEVSSPDWSALGPDLVVNGSFEEPQIPQLPGNPFTNKFRYFPDSELGSLPGWSSVVDNRPIEIQTNACCTPFDGTQHVEVDSDGNGRIRQILSTNEGADYQLSYAYSPQVAKPKETNRINVYWDGLRIETLAEDGGLEDTIWQVRTFDVQAGGNPSTLEFEAAGLSDQVGGLIDAVKLQLKTKSVGAVTQGNGLTGTTGEVSSDNSEVGGMAGDQSTPSGTTTVRTSSLVVDGSDSADRPAGEVGDAYEDAVLFSGNSLSIRAVDSMASKPNSNITLIDPVASSNDVDLSLEAGRSILLESDIVANGFAVEIIVNESEKSTNPQNQDVNSITLNSANISSTADIKLQSEAGAIELSRSALLAPGKRIAVQANKASFRDDSLLDASDPRDGSLGGSIDIATIQGVTIDESRLLTSGVITGGSIAIAATAPTSTVEIIGSDLIADPAGEGGSVVINGAFIAVSGGSVIADETNGGSLLDVTGSDGGLISIGTRNFTQEIFLDEGTILRAGPNPKPLQLEALRIIDLSTKVNGFLPDDLPQQTPSPPQQPPSAPPTPASSQSTAEPVISLPPIQSQPPTNTPQPVSNTPDFIIPAEDVIAFFSTPNIQPTDYVDTLFSTAYNFTPLGTNATTSQLGLNPDLVALDQQPSFSYLDGSAFPDLQNIQLNAIPFSITETSIQESSANFIEAEQQAAKEVSNELGLENTSTTESFTAQDVQKALQQMIRQARCKRGSSEPECN